MLEICANRWALHPTVTPEAARGGEKPRKNKTVLRRQPVENPRTDALTEPSFGFGEHGGESTVRERPGPSGPSSVTLIVAESACRRAVPRRRGPSLRTARRRRAGDVVPPAWLVRWLPTAPSAASLRTAADVAMVKYFEGEALGGEKLFPVSVGLVFA